MTYSTLQRLNSSRKRRAWTCLERHSTSERHHRRLTDGSYPIRARQQSLGRWRISREGVLMLEALQTQLGLSDKERAAQEQEWLNDISKIKEGLLVMETKFLEMARSA